MGLSDSPHSRWPWRLAPVAALLALAALVRAPIVVVPPLLPEFQQSFGLSTVELALLTSIPVLCFGILTPVVSQLIHFIGINHAVLYGLIGVITGSLWRISDSLLGLYGGTVLIGLGLTIGNLAVPMLIGREHRHRSALMTGTCTAVTNVGVTLATAAAVPLALYIGWQRSSAMWGAALGGTALLIWLLVYPPGIRGPRPSLHRRAGGSDLVQTVRQGRAELRSTLRPPLRRWRVAWLLAGAFAGHTLSYYAVTSWLPLALSELRDMDLAQAGVAAAVFQASGIIGPFIVPWLVSSRRWPVLRCAIAISVCWALLPLSMIVAPTAWLPLSVVSGAAQGAFFTLLFMLVVSRTRSVDENRRLAAMIQTTGYSVAAAGPVAMGWVHDVLTHWGAAFGVVLVAVMAMATCLIMAVRDSSEPPEPVPPRGAEPTR